jgi:hypothetical protein
MMKMTDRELDALVAEKVMGWIIGYPLADAPDGMPPRPPGDTRSHYDYPVLVPAYSTDITAAWQVVEKMEDLGYHWRFANVIPSSDPIVYTMKFMRMDTDAKETEFTAPLAICRAALKAVEVENDG